LQVAQQADVIARLKMMSDGALQLFNLIIGSYSDEVTVSEGALNMMLCAV
jgi:hypothetical protein